MSSWFLDSVRSLFGWFPENPPRSNRAFKRVRRNWRPRTFGYGSTATALSASLFDKEYDREILADRGNQLWLFTDIPRQFDAWDIDASYDDEGLELCSDTPPECIETGPLRAAIRVRRRHEEVEIIQDYCLTRGSRILEIRTRSPMAWTTAIPPRAFSSADPDP